VPTAEGAAPKKGKGKWFAIGAVVLGGATAAVVGAMALGGGESGGAADPEAAVQGVADALTSEDPLAVLTFIAPDEITGVSEMVETLQARITEVGLGEVATGGDVDVEITLTDIEVDELGENAARVDLSIDLGLTGGGGETPLATLFGDETLEIEDIELPVIAVRIDGGWYVSPMLTVGENIVELADLPDGDYQLVTDDREDDGPDGPVAAVEALAEGLTELDREAVAAALGSAEARVLAVFGDAIDEGIDALEAEGVSFDLDSVDATDLGDGQVAIDALEVAISQFGDTTTLEVDEDCLEFLTADYDSRACFAQGLPFEDDLVEDRVVLVTDEQDGGTRIDLVGSVMRLATEVIGLVDRDTALRAAGLEVLDTPEQIAFGDVLEAELPDRPFAVYETVIPADTLFDIDVTGDVSEDTYVFEDGLWQREYFSRETVDEDTTVRIVVRGYCQDDYDDESVFNPCPPSTDAEFTLAVSSIRTETMSFPGTVSGTLDAGQVVGYAFTVTEETEVDLVQVGDVYADVEGPWQFGEVGDYLLPPGDYVLYVEAYQDGSGTDFEAGFEVVEPGAPAGELSADNPFVSVDLSNGPVTVDLYLDTGDEVDLYAYPLDGQDIVLTVLAGSGEVCSEDQGFAGDEEVCPFSVTGGGLFTVEISGWSTNDEYGQVSVELYLD
jgi:hypothetical protein